MLKFKFKVRYTPHVGLYFVYNKQIFKIVKFKNERMWFAWFDDKLKKVLHTNLEDPGMDRQAWSDAVKNDKYSILNERNVLIHELRIFEVKEK